MNFIKFNDDDIPTLYPVNQIESICLYDEYDEIEYVLKIILFIKDASTGVSECFYYCNAHEHIEAQKEARRRFDELLTLLNQ